MNKLLLFFLLILPLKISWATEKSGTDLMNIQFKTLEYNNEKFLGIEFLIEKDWHVYWKNPGDSGIATEFKFTANNKPAPLEMLEWPHPHLFKEAGDLWTFGYKDTVKFFTTYKDVKQVQIEIIYLICRELCIPGKQTFDLNINEIPKEMLSQSEMSSWKLAFDQNPKLLENNNIKWQLYRIKGKELLYLSYEIPNFEMKNINEDYQILTSFITLPWNIKHESVYQNAEKNIIGISKIEWDGNYSEPKVALPEDGIFKGKDKLSFLLWDEKTKSSSILNFNPQAMETLTEEQWNKKIAELNPVTNAKEKKKVVNKTENDSQSIILILLFAFIGGFILNFMPCVLPIISLKLFGLIQREKKEKSTIMKHHLSYTGGVILSFWILALILFILKSAGENLGWGFQLQSPSFVYALIILFFILSLNLFGLFEFNTPGGKYIGKLRSNHPYLDDFFSGLLAVIVATPCSAPFLGPALTFAFTAESWMIPLCFTFIGLGLSLPFILTAIFPQLLKIFPKPGNWMNIFKLLMGFGMLSTVLWLIQVLLGISDGELLFFPLFFSLLLLFFTLYLLTKFPKEKSGIIFFIFMTLYTSGKTFSLINSDPKELQKNNTSKDSLQWHSWDPNLIKKWQSEGKNFFLDFTAKWCITCQVNKKLVFETGAFKEFVELNHLEVMRVDWTKKDPEIYEWIKSHGAVSVPAYFLGLGEEITFLGETISIDKIQSNLK